MRRAPIIEDWSRFNRAVMDVADGRTPPALAKPPASLAPRPEPAVPPTAGREEDSYGLIARQKWRRRA